MSYQRTEIKLVLGSKLDTKILVLIDISSNFRVKKKDLPLKKNLEYVNGSSDSNNLKDKKNRLTVNERGETSIGLVIINQKPFFPGVKKGPKWNQIWMSKSTN